MSSTLSVTKLVNRLAEKQTKSDSRINSWFKKIILKELNNIVYGEIVLQDREQVFTFKGKQKFDLKIDITVLDENFYSYIALGGSVGAGEAYINNFWSSNDVTKVIQLFAINQSVMDSMEGGFAKITRPLKQGFHWLNKNTRKGSKSNIVAHYDLGNEFFKLFLDPTMMYSSGIFLNEQDSMEAASNNKLKRICQRLRLKPSDHIIEIGTGWGGFAIYAAKNYGCKVTTTTISEEQFEYTKNKISEAGLENQITLLKEDYRNLSGQFDKLVSIEMIEAVGHHFFNTFFEKCSSLLKPEGEMLLQAITIADQRFESAKKEVDYIKRYIFPGSCIPSIDSISKSITSSTDLRILNSEDIGVHYALTLKAWRETFMNRLDEVKALGFSDAFIRLWEFYLCYCEGGFRERVISVVQMHKVKPLARVPMQMSRLEN